MRKMTKSDKIFVCHGASNHSKYEREPHDFYATDPKAVEMLMKLETFHKNIWEPAVGEGHIADVLKRHGHIVIASDIVNRGYGDTYRIDFLAFDEKFRINFDIITNPPYKYAKEFVEKAIEVIPNGCKIAMLLKLTFLEGKKRRELFEKYPPKIIYVSSGRLSCAKNGDFERYKTGTAIAHAWFIWEKGFKGEPVVRWFN